MVMMQRWGLRCGWSLHVSLLRLHRVRSSITIQSSHGSAPYACPRLVRGVVEQSTNVMNEQRIQLLRNLLLVCEFECTFKGNPTETTISTFSPSTRDNNQERLPDTFEVHWADFDYMARLLALQDAVSAPARHSGHVE